MTGNVWEWCLDETFRFLSKFPIQNPITKAGSTDEIMDKFMNVKTERTLCGGSWRDNAQSALLPRALNFSRINSLEPWIPFVRAATD